MTHRAGAIASFCSVKWRVITPLNETDTNLSQVTLFTDLKYGKLDHSPSLKFDFPCIEDKYLVKNE